MKINNSIFNQSFQKRLVANANILKNNQPYPVEIYEVNKKEDEDYFEKLSQNDNWRSANLLKYVQEQFSKTARLRFTHGLKLKFYTVEDKKQNCLGIVQVDNSKLNSQEILYIEAQPANKKSKEYKYIGETMLSFLVKQQQSNKRARQLFVPLPLDDARDFYLKSLFCFDSTPWQPLRMYLPLNNEESLISINEVHTKSKIELVDENAGK